MACGLDGDGLCIGISLIGGSMTGVFGDDESRICECIVICRVEGKAKVDMVTSSKGGRNCASVCIELSL